MKISGSPSCPLQYITGTSLSLLVIAVVVPGSGKDTARHPASRPPTFPFLPFADPEPVDVRVRILISAVANTPKRGQPGGCPKSKRPGPPHVGLRLDPVPPAGMGLFPPDPMKIFPCLQVKQKCVEVKNMKTLKIGVMLLALLLAAMIMVPMVSAQVNSVSNRSDNES